MAFSENILPKSHTGYITNNAHFDASGKLILGSRGSVRLNLTKDTMPKLTQNMRVTVTAEKSTSAYNPLVYVELRALLKDDSYYTGVATVSFESENDSAGTAVVDIPLVAGDYKAFAYRIYSLSSQEFVILDWSLSYEVSDADLTTVIDGVTQSLPHLLYDYNTEAITVRSTELICGLISCKLLGNTDIQGHFLATVNASEDCTMYVRMKDNSIEELYAPLEYQLTAGKNVIAVPHAYLNRKKGKHTFVVTMQVTNGYCLIHTRGVMFTIDGGYLAKQLVDIGMDVMDITMQQATASEAPSDIWAIGILSGDVMVKHRPYDSKDATEASWTSDYSVGKATACAIEFDGDWVRYGNSETFTLETYAQPYIFLVAPETGELTVQKGSDGDHKVVLDTGVSKVSAVRGFKSSVYKEQDQGLIVAYIKGGKAYYRTYAYLSSEAKYAWYSAEQVGDYTDVVSLQVHRLNDYRVGFAITTATKNLWLITDRTYVGQAVPPEKKDFGSAKTHFASIAVIKGNVIIDKSYEVQELQFTGASDTLPITFKNPPVIYGKLEDALKESTYTFNGQTSPIKSLEVVDNTLNVILPESVLGTVTVKLSDLVQLHVEGGFEALFLPMLTWHVVRHINVALDKETYDMGKIIPDNISVVMHAKRDVYKTIDPEVYNAGSVQLDQVSIVLRPIITSDISDDITPETINFGTVAFDSATITVLLVGAQPI